jgi:putative Mn2+ efflux pump MntP
MNTKFTYALIITIVQAVFNLLMYFTGHQTEKLATGQYLNWIALPITFILLWLGIRAGREESADKSLSYGQGVGAGTLISLFSGLMSGVYNYIHFKFIAPEFFDYQMELIRTKWTQAGMNSTQMEQAEHFTKMMMGPVVTAISTPIMAVVLGVILSLIIAAFLKRPAPAAAVPPVAASAS